MTHHMLSTLKPLIDVMAPGGTLVSNIKLVFFISEKHWKNFMPFTPKPEMKNEHEQTNEWMVYCNWNISIVNSTSDCVLSTLKAKKAKKSLHNHSFY